MISVGRNFTNSTLSEEKWKISRFRWIGFSGLFLHTLWNTACTVYHGGIMAGLYLVLWSEWISSTFCLAPLVQTSTSASRSVAKVDTRYDQMSSSKNLGEVDIGKKLKQHKHSLPRKATLTRFLVVEWRGLRP